MGKFLDIDYLEYRPAAAYIDGEYWGIYNIREKISEHYVEHRHGVDPDIKVVDNPAEMAKGIDPQLQKAIEVVMQELKNNPPLFPKQPPYQKR